MLKLLDLLICQSLRILLPTPQQRQSLQEFHHVPRDVDASRNLPMAHVL